jgi:beta-glucosidase
MPGTNKWRSLDLVSRTLQARKITTRTLKTRARAVLELVQKAARGAPEVLDGDGLERTADTPESKDLLRKVAAEGIVLLRNEGGVLPLAPERLRKVAVIGPNAKAVVLSGGGSAALKPSFFVSPYEGIVNALKAAGTEVTYCEGARGVLLFQFFLVETPEF